MGTHAKDAIAQKLAYDGNGVLSGKSVPGMVSQGNIDVNHRPLIMNADGSHSSIYSMTVPIAKDGSPVSWEAPNIANYALVPSIANGKFLSPDGKMPTTDQGNQQLEDAATLYYGKTRQNLGVFQSPGYADEYANLNHDYINNGTAQQIYTPSPAIRSIVENTQRNVNAPVPNSVAAPVSLPVPIPKFPRR